MNSADQNQIGNCTLLTSQADFAGYIQKINATTNFTLPLLEACQSNICNALWGNGNADISGIGMIVGYMFESALSLLLAIGFAIQQAQRPELLPKIITGHANVLKKAHKIFFDCAVFFAASIQIACVVVLVRRDFGISANGLGGFTTQITWAIAVLSMLPLIYPHVALDTKLMVSKKSGYRLFLFCGCWVLFFYTFISQMIGSFAPTQIGQGNGDGGITIITDEEWNKLTTLCLTGVESLTSREEKLLSAFGAAGSLVVATYGLTRLVWYIYFNTHVEHAKKIYKGIPAFLGIRKLRPIPLVLTWILLFLTLVVPQFWGVLRLRGIQRALADATKNIYVDNQWTFGQVVAVMIFAPVVTEVGHSLLKDEGELPSPIGGSQGKKKTRVSEIVEEGSDLWKGDGAGKNNGEK
ncbi:hypothetical protein BGZ60DRAFT_433477 [Tricladium varicosporioides]|nr:hypothetical protein BGZ60DRAFT_433477 [Hymenoscyphus varicosporioides]